MEIFSNHQKIKAGWNEPAFTVFMYSFYMIGMGIGFISIPNVLITFFGFQPTYDVWIRLLGMLSFVAGVYYLVAAKNNLVPFFEISVWGRLFFTIGEIILVVTGQAPKTLLLFALVEGTGAFWTYFSLKK